MTDTTGWIFDLQRFSLHNGPGIRSTVFFKGCPLRCWWCHNPESQLPGKEVLLWEGRCIHCGFCLEACPQAAIAMVGNFPITDQERCTLCGTCAEECFANARQMVGREIGSTELVCLLERDLPFYQRSGGGVTLSGGEPLQQPEFLGAALKGCKQRGIHTALDTCGYAPWQILDQVRMDIDLFLYDLKLVDEHLHQQYTGVSNRLILENLRRLARLGHAIALRIPIIPGVNDDEENLKQTAELAHSLPSRVSIDLLPYHTIAAEKYRRASRSYQLPDLQSPSTETMDKIVDVFSQFDLAVSIGG
jgi:pyruvate formate lyase activating enzyme